MSTPFLSDLGRYGHLVRRDDLRTTHRDRDNLPAQPDPEPLRMRTPRDTGTTPAQVQAELQQRLEGGSSVVAWTDEHGVRHSALYVPHRPAGQWSPEALARLLRDVRGGR